MEVDDPRLKGGCVFPRLESWTNEDGVTLTDPVQGGLTLRQHFAGLAMQSIIGAIDRRELSPAELSWPGYVANEAIDYADALIKALEKT